MFELVATCTWVFNVYLRTCKRLEPLRALDHTVGRVYGIPTCSSLFGVHVSSIRWRAEAELASLAAAVRVGVLPVRGY
jgi:hypothetical protein